MKPAVIWILPLCGQCREVKARLEELGYEVEERGLGELIAARGAPVEENLEALAQFCAQNNIAPVVRADGKFLMPGAVLERNP